MRMWVLEFLACPRCGDSVELNAQAVDGDDVLTGSLRCERCDITYAIEQGIAKMLPSSTAEENLTASHFEQEFAAPPVEDADFDPLPLREYIFLSRTGLDADVYDAYGGDPYPTSLGTPKNGYSADLSRLDGLTVLDAGAGPGRFIDVVASSGAARVVGLELGDHVQRARARTRHLPHVEMVQGSVLEPPFRTAVFDFVYSIGVLHHTPDPAGGVMALAGLVGGQGSMSIWVYPPEYWGGPLRAPVGRLVHAVLSRLAPRRAFAVCRRVLYPIGRVQMWLAHRRWTKMLAAPLFLLAVPRHPDPTVMLGTIYDYFCPPIISTHEPDEVREWLEEAGFERVEQLPVRTAMAASGRPGTERPEVAQRRHPS